MTNADRVIWNSIVLYAKILICIVLSLWSVPIILHSLGNSDYGLYALVGGVIGMLAFLRTAMASSTQRYLNVSLGENDIPKMNELFNSSITLHLIISVIIVVGLEAITPFLFGNFLNISFDRMFAGKIIYQTLIASTFFTIMATPFDAELNAYENMTVFAIIEILDAILKLILAFSLQYISWDKLIWYGIGMAIIPFLNLLIKFIYTRNKYKDLYLCRSLLWKPEVFKQMLNFTSWNTFGALALVGRNQGIAIVLNLFYGTVMNAAYGIANQINGVMGFFSQTLRKSIHPQLMLSYGRNEHARMTRLVFTSSKFCVLVMGVIAIPLIVELPLVLNLWLTDVPPYALEFTRLILIFSMVYQMSAGLMAGILAVGKMKTYQIVISIIMLLTLPFAYFMLKLGYEPYWVLISMLIFEILDLVAHLIFSKHLFDLNISLFCWKVVIPLILILGICWLTLSGITHIMETSFMRLIINSVVSVIIIGPLSWLLLINDTEKKSIGQFVQKFTHRKES